MVKCRPYLWLRWAAFKSHGEVGSPFRKRVPGFSCLIMAASSLHPHPPPFPLESFTDDGFVPFVSSFVFATPYSFRVPSFLPLSSESSIYFTNLTLVLPDPSATSSTPVSCWMLCVPPSCMGCTEHDPPHGFLLREQGWG